MIEKSKAGEIDSLLMAKAVLSKSAEKRMFDSKLLTQKESTKSSMEGHLEAHNDDKTHSEKGLAATLEYITLLALHLFFRSALI